MPDLVQIVRDTRKQLPADRLQRRADAIAEASALIQGKLGSFSEVDLRRLLELFNRDMSHGREVQGRFATGLVGHNANLLVGRLDAVNEILPQLWRADDPWLIANLIQLRSGGRLPGGGWLFLSMVLHARDQRRFVPRTAKMSQGLALIEGKPAPRFKDGSDYLEYCRRIHALLEQHEIDPNGADILMLNAYRLGSSARESAERTEDVPALTPAKPMSAATVRASQPSPPVSVDVLAAGRALLMKRLEDLLALLLDEHELRALFARLGLAAELPGTGASLAQLAYTGAGLLHRRGRIDAVLFTELIARAGNHADMVRVVAADLGVDRIPVPVVDPPGQPDAALDLPPALRYPLLSEWTTRRAGRWLLANGARRLRRLGWIVIALFVVLGALALALSSAASAACIEVTVAAGDRKDWFVYGYLAELPHGLWYLTGAPIFVFAMGVFIQRATYYLRSAAENGRLTVDPPAPGGRADAVLEWYARANRRVFTALTIVLGLASLAIMLYGEHKSWEDDVFGWVQARQAPRLEGRTLGELRALGTALLPIEAELCPGRAGECTIEQVRGGSRSTDERAWFLPFIALALTIQVCFAFICFYGVAKIIFFVAVHIMAISGIGGIRLQLDFSDGNRRMGLKRLDEPIFAALWLAGIGGTGFCLISLANNEKGSRFFLDGPALVPANVSHGAGFLVSALLWVTAFCVPLWYFDFACYRAMTGERRRLEQLAMGSGAARAALEAQLNLTDEQRARPRERKILVLGWSFFILSLLMPTLLWAESSWQPVTAIREVVARRFPRSVCQVLGQLVETQRRPRS